MKSDFWYYWEWAHSTLLGALHQKPYGEEWDRVLNKLLDEYADSAKWGEYTVLLGGVEVWVGNRMFDYGFPYNLGRGGMRYRTGVSTMIRLAKLQDQAGVTRLKKKEKEEEEYWNSLVVNT